MTVVFIDTETTSLDPETGEIWEVALIKPNPGKFDDVHHWFLDVDLDFADLISLDIGGFHDRHPYGNSSAGSGATVTTRSVFADEFAELTHRAHLAGCVISFDEQRLRTLLRDFGRAPSWHYHLCDVEALAAGHLGVTPPWTSRTLSVALNVPIPDDADRHTALGDAQWAKDIYDAVYSPPQENGLE